MPKLEKSKRSLSPSHFESRITKKHKKHKQKRDDANDKIVPSHRTSSSPDDNMMKHRRTTDRAGESKRDKKQDDASKYWNEKETHKFKKPAAQSRKSNQQDRAVSKRHIDQPIKREEDFDQRQEELSRRRLQGRNDNDFVNHERSRHTTQVKQEVAGNYDRDRRGDQHQRDRRRYDDERRRNRERRDNAHEIEDAFNASPENDQPAVEKEKPNLGLSGALTEDTNTYKGVVIKYSEPPEARIPKKRWRLYPFKGTEALKVMHLHRQSAYLIGRLRRIADIPVDHPSCSKQHAVFQFRMIEEEVDGVLKRRVKPYIIDLGAANGTYVNNERIDSQRYVELKEQDVLKFGYSSREYVLLHEKSDTGEVAENESEGDED